MAKPQKAQQDCKTQKLQNKMTKSCPKPHKTPPANVTHIMSNIQNHLLFGDIPLSGVQSQIAKQIDKKLPKPHKTPPPNITHNM